MANFGSRISGFFGGGTSGGGGGGGVTSITFTSPLTGGTITSSGTVGIPLATSSANGYLSSSDWTTFNSKIGGSGTATRIAFFSASGTLSSSNNLYWDNANSRLGIGTTAPTFRLQVTGSDAIINTVRAGRGNGTFVGNTAFGTNALESTLADNNTAIGYQALRLNTDGTLNTAIGRQALTNNTEGVSNVAVGNGALRDNTIGLKNIAVGDSVLRSCTQGARNVAIGDQSLFALNDGSNNTAIGDSSGIAIVSGSDNTFIGKNSGNQVTFGTNNTFLGLNTGQNIITGSDNTFIGRGMTTGGDDSNYLIIGAGGVKRIQSDNNLNTEVYASTFRTIDSASGVENGIKLDFGNYGYTFGQIDDGASLVECKHFIDGTAGSQSAYFTLNFARLGYEFDFGATTFKYGDINGVYGVNRIELDATNSTMAFKNDQSVGSTTFEANQLVFTGANLQSGTSGASSGQHLVITLNGVVYHIDLKNP